MPTVTISLPEDVKTLAEAEATRLGQTLEQYVANLIIARADQPVSPPLEEELLKGLDSPPREVSPRSWEDKRRRFEGRHHGRA